MQVSIKWLKDYIDFDETPEQLADLLTMAGVPVENVVRADEGLDKVVTGKLAAVARRRVDGHALLGGRAENGDGELAGGAENRHLYPARRYGGRTAGGESARAGRLRFGVRADGEPRRLLQRVRHRAGDCRADRENAALAGTTKRRRRIW